MLKWFRVEIYKDGKNIFGDVILRENREAVQKYLTELTNTPEYSDADEAKFMELKPIKEMMQIGLERTDVFDLLIVLDNFIDLQNRNIEEVKAREKAGEPTVLFDNYTDFYAALYAVKNNAKRLLKELQKQTGEVVLYEEAIDRL